MWFVLAFRFSLCVEAIRDFEEAKCWSFVDFSHCHCVCVRERERDREREGEGLRVIAHYA